MKRVLTYPELKTLSDKIADKILSGPKNFNLIAISRGGVTAAHRIAYILGKPLNYWSPDRGLAWVIDSMPAYFIEDLVAKGRTYEMVKARFAGLDIRYCPLVVDSEYANVNGTDQFFAYGVVSSDWIVFPYEDESRVVEKDWGLFREGTAESSKPFNERGQNE